MPQLASSLLEQARTQFRAGDPAAALARLRSALALHPDYPFFLRAEKLAAKIALHAPARRHTRIALLGTSTTTFLASVLKLLCLGDGIAAEFYEAPFGALHQTVLEGDSPLYAFQPDFVILLVNWRDATHPDDAALCENLWDRLAARTSARILQTTFAPPPADPWHALSAARPDGRIHILRAMNQRLFESARERVDLLDTETLAARYPGIWDNPVQWSTARMYPSAGALPLLAAHIVSFLRAHLGLTRKVLALDLDNTLWGGVVGEDGVNGIQLGPPSAVGERYQDLQRYLLSLHERGILLAAVSRNNPEDAAAGFRHPASVLTPGHFAAFAANWNDKPENLRHIARSLSLALDSFVFLDDNPAERERVRTALPEIAVPEITGEPALTIEALERGLYFQTLAISEEDRQRAASYRARENSRQLLASSVSLTDYLDSLHMTVHEEPVDTANLTRVAQLINKTNQFNLTTRHYTADQVRARMTSDRWWCRAFRLTDRFTDHGVVGVLLVEKTDPGWRVDTWLLSCRVIGRGVEKFMFNTLLSAARCEHAESLAAEYLPTPKNEPVRTLLSDLGFHAGALDPRTAREAGCPWFQ
jgi:FkbH-like protein